MRICSYRFVYETKIGVDIFYISWNKYGHEGNRAPVTPTVLLWIYVEIDIH